MTTLWGRNGPLGKVRAALFPQLCGGSPARGYIPYLVHPVAIGLRDARFVWATLAISEEPVAASPKRPPCAAISLGQSGIIMRRHLPVQRRQRSTRTDQPFASALA